MSPILSATPPFDCAGWRLLRSRIGAPIDASSHRQRCPGRPFAFHRFIHGRRCTWQIFARCTTPIVFCLAFRLRRLAPAPLKDRGSDRCLLASPALSWAPFRLPSFHPWQVLHLANLCPLHNTHSFLPRLSTAQAGACSAQGSGLRSMPPRIASVVLGALSSSIVSPMAGAALRESHIFALCTLCVILAFFPEVKYLTWNIKRTSWQNLSSNK